MFKLFSVKYACLHSIINMKFKKSVENSINTFYD